MPFIRPFIEYDVDEFTACSLDTMLAHLLYECRDASVSVDKETLFKQCLEVVLPLANGISAPNQTVHPREIKNYIAEYAATVGELQRYAPFAGAANAALMCLGDIDIPGIRQPKSSNDCQNILFQRHDLKEIHQTHKGHISARKPDVVVVPWEAAKQAHRGYGSHQNKKQQYLASALKNPPKSVQWQDVRCAVEFKSKKKGALPTPPQTYTVQDWVEPKPGLLELKYLRDLQKQLDEEQERRLAQLSSSVAQTSSNASNLVGDTQVGSSSKAHVAMRHTHSGTQVSSTSLKRPLTDEQASDQSSSKRLKSDSQTGLQTIKAPQNTPAIVQSGAYAAEMFASHLALQHVLNLVIVDDLVYIWYFDRQYAIQCYGFNFIKDLPRFLVLLLIMDRFTTKQWGINEVFEIEQIGPRKRLDLESECGKVSMVLGSPIATHFGLRGRATNVYSVSELELPGEAPYSQHIPGDEHIVKIFWAEESRENEPELIKKAHAIAQMELDVVGHLPEPVWWGKFQDTSTAPIRQALGLQDLAKDDDEANKDKDGVNKDTGTTEVRGSRVLWVIVFRKLRPIAELGSKEMVKTWWQIVRCHYALWKQGLYHRDISENNLMYYRDKNDIPVGVLNDFDLSSTKQNQQGHERTGTIPFMAIQLLKQQSIAGHRGHLYQHDAESFIWVLTWLSLAYENGQRRYANANLEVLFSLSAFDCGVRKASFLFDCTHVTPRWPSQVENWALARKCLQLVAFHMVVPAVLEDKYVYREWLCKNVESHLGINAM